jgi:predicted nuclease with RNAse H fold
MAQSEPTLPTLRTLAMLALRDADMLLSFAERLYATQTTIEARWALRRIDTYRRLLDLPLSISSMERIAARSIQRGEHLRRGTVSVIGTARHSVAKQYDHRWLRLAAEGQRRAVQG